MKKNLMLIVLSFLALQGFGQTETLFNRARVVGAFGAPITEFSQFKGDYIVSSGGGTKKYQVHKLTSSGSLTRIS